MTAHKESTGLVISKHVGKEGFLLLAKKIFDDDWLDLYKPNALTLHWKIVIKNEIKWNKK